MIWCEHCRDHFSTSHYGPHSHLAPAEHLAGSQYGPYGALLARAQISDEELARLENAISSIGLVAEAFGNLIAQLAPLLTAALKEIENIGKRS